MVKQDSHKKQHKGREDLLQQFMEKMFSLMRQIHRDISPTEPLLSPPQARLAFIIAKYEGEGISVKELARIADMTPGAITQFTDVLITKNLVTREQDPSDRRMVRLKVTPSAKSQMEIIRKNFLTAATRKLAVLSTDELKQINSLLAKVTSEPSDRNHLK